MTEIEAELMAIGEENSRIRDEVDKRATWRSDANGVEDSENSGSRAQGKTLKQDVHINIYQSEIIMN